MMLGARLGCTTPGPCPRTRRTPVPQRGILHVEARSSSSGRSSANGKSSASGKKIIATETLEPVKSDAIVDVKAAGSGPFQFWEALEGRYKIVFATSLSFVICNMDKVNMSVAIIPMAQDFGWSPSVSGIVQSSFFWGYMLCQLPGGLMSSKFSGRKVLPAGVTLWSLSTAAVPLLAATIPGLCLSRAAVGLGEAVAPSAATDIVARVVPPTERSRAVSFIFGGLHVGSILGLLAAPPIISKFGWEAVFVAFGVVGVFWTLWFEKLIESVGERNPEVVEAMGRAVGGSEGVGEREDGGEVPIPWKAFFKSREVQVLMYTHFCNNWFHYTMLAWLPTYFTDTLDVDLMHAAQTALLPPIAGIAASAAAGPTADALISRGMSVSLVRKLAQGVAFIGPTACLVAACVSEDSNLTVGLITIALGLSSFSLAGLYCSHQDLNPRYASILLGLTNTTGALPGIVGVATVGLLLDQTQSWPVALFIPSAVFMVTGALVYGIFGRNDFVDFDKMQADMEAREGGEKRPWWKQ